MHTYTSICKTRGSINRVLGWRRSSMHYDILVATRTPCDGHVPAAIPGFSKIHNGRRNFRYEPRSSNQIPSSRRARGQLTSETIAFAFPPRITHRGSGEEDDGGGAPPPPQTRKKINLRLVEISARNLN
jgi:hypothetical protein